MIEFLNLIGIPVGIVGIYLTIKNQNLSTFWQRLLGFAEILILIGSIVGFGLIWGSIVAGVAILISFLITSLVLYMKLEAIVVDAAVYADSKKQEMFAFHREVYKMDKAMKYLGQLKVATLIRQLAIRHRSFADMRQMVVPIALLAVINREVDIVELVDKFDSILRAYDYEPSKAMEIADKLTKAMQISPMSFEELLQAFDTFGSPELQRP